MSDMIFYKNGEETFRISPPTVGTKCPETKLEVKKMTEITLKLTFEELKTLDKYVELNDETRPLFDKIQNAYPKPETLLDVIRNLGYSYDMCYEIVDAVEEFEKSKEPEKWDVVRESKKWCEEHPGESVEDYLKPQTPEQVADGLKEAFREAVKQGIVSSVDKPKPMNEVLDRLENKYENDVSENKQKPKTLYDILYRWWMDIFCNPIYRDWDMETSIEDLVDRIEFWNMRIKNDDEVELDEQENDKNFKNSLDLIREWGEKNKPPTLTELLWEWWDCNDIFTSNSDLDADTCIDYLVNIIGKKFIPPSSDRNGYEWEKCLKMMRDKLR
jgi:hypothetical protein